LSPVALWVLLCAFLNCTGWILSAVHQLNRTGYAVAFLLAFGVGYWLHRKRRLVICPRFSFRKQRRRFRRGLPLAFLILAAVAIVGGVIYAPSNYDALAYRVPRGFHWLAEGRWHWVHTEFNRLNTRACGFEWVAAPLMAFTRGYRWLFLINAVSFLLLPGLLFSLLVRLGVRARVAWHWMWLAPTGYCYLLQAGSIANDLFGAVFAVAAIDFARRARQWPSGPETWLSLLAAALMTAAAA